MQGTGLCSLHSANSLSQDRSQEVTLTHSCHSVCRPALNIALLPPAFLYLIIAPHRTALPLPRPSASMTLGAILTFHGIATSASKLHLLSGEEGEEGKGLSPQWIVLLGILHSLQKGFVRLIQAHWTTLVHHYFISEDCDTNGKDMNFHHSSKASLMPVQWTMYFC